jgi:hypothetical protein
MKGMMYQVATTVAISKYTKQNEKLSVENRMEAISKIT